jgi:hypothetical protein
MERGISILETSYPAEKIGRITYQILGKVEYEIIRNILQRRGNEYMLDILCDSMFISGSKFFSSLYSGSLYRIMYEIETTTPSIYYLLYTRLTEREIQESFNRFENRIISDKCFNINQTRQLVACTSNADFVRLTKMFIRKRCFLSVSTSRKERINAWVLQSEQLKRELSRICI